MQKTMRYAENSWNMIKQLKYDKTVGIWGETVICIK